MFDRILIPTDGSEQAKRAAKKGIELATEHDATVHGLYVIEPVYTADVGTGQIIEALRAEGKRAVEALAEQAEAKGLTATTAVREGVPHKEILAYAEENDVDLVVMGTHGRSGLDRYLLGSVTEKVVRTADCPVLTVRPPGK